MSFVCDIHNHLPVKTYLYNKPCLFNVSLLETNLPASVLKLMKFYNPETEIFRVLSTVPKMEAGGVNALVATHYVPEDQFLSNVKKEYTALVKALAPIFFPELLDRIESKTTVFEQTLESFDVLEAKVKEANRAGARLVIARTFPALEKAVQAGDRILIHALEGAHHLGRGLTQDEIREAVRTLKKRGVCYITLAHFFDNGYAMPIEGLPPDVRDGFMRDSYRDRDRDVDAQQGLPPAGKMLVNEMFDQGIIVDLTHTSPQGRRDVYALNRARRDEGKPLRPLIMSHVGVEAEFVRNQGKNSPYRYLCASNEDIEAIAESGGVIGVIFFNYWLAGLTEKKHSDTDFGIEHIFRAMEYIKERTGTYDNVAIGTDFDGMTDTPDDYRDISSISRLRAYLGIHLKHAEVNAILGNNFLRVLRNGWG
ncbi:MAG: membrane dipeptidase [Ignavibacteriae bacterium]|nr:membrane dipeptidase [Ignavibacteriota bacterium]